MRANKISHEKHESRKAAVANELRELKRIPAAFCIRFNSRDSLAKIRSRFLFSCLLCLSWTLFRAAAAHAASERVSHIQYVTPRAGQRGSTVEVTIEGAYLNDAREALFFRPGIKCVGIKPLPPLPARRLVGFGGYVEERILCRFEIAPDAPAGLYPFKLRTGTELTSLSTFAVTPFPLLEEGEEKLGVNDTLATAKAVPLNTSVLGRMDSAKAADVDLYRVHGEAGTHLSVEVDSVRLTECIYASPEFDLMVRLLDADGKELARNDDNALHVQDPISSIVLPRTGDYFVEIKQRVFWTGTHVYYLAHIGSNRRPLAVYPAGGPAGKLEATLLGDPAGEVRQSIALPGEAGDFSFAGDWPSPLPMRVSAYPNVLEDRAADQTRVPALPTALNGTIEQPGDEDRFVVAVKKGERWRVRVFACSLGMPLDPNLTIRRVGSETIELEGDDATLEQRGLPGMLGQSGDVQCKERLDPSVIWEPKEDGEYVVAIRDMRGLGNPLAVYRIEIEPVRDEIDTYFTGRIADDTECPRLTGLAVPQGNRWTVSLGLSEGQGNAYKGDLEIVAHGLPRGVSIYAPRVAAGAKSAQVQFVCEPGTAPQVGLISLLARAADGSPLASFCQQGFPFINHSGGNSWHTVVLDKFAFAITDPAPFHIELVQPRISLSQNGELAVAVKVTRRPGFTEPIEFQCDWVPPGVQSEATQTIPGDASEAVLRLHADALAKPGSFQMAATASTTGGWYYTGAGRVRVSTGFIELTVAEPYFTLTSHPAAVRRGGTAQVVWDVEMKKPFPGEAAATLLGLPGGLQVIGTPKLRAGDSKLVFEIAAAPEALMGLSKELTCEFVLQESGQEIRQRMGKGTLRVDPALTATEKPEAR